MSKQNDEIETKKKELEEKLKELQSGIESNLVTVKTEVSEQLNPTNIVNNYPLASVSLAVVAGFFLTRIGKSKPKTTSSNKSIISDSIGVSIKKKLSRKATDFILDYIEQRLSNKPQK